MADDWRNCIVIPVKKQPAIQDNAYWKMESTTVCRREQLHVYTMKISTKVVCKYKFDSSGKGAILPLKQTYHFDTIIKKDH